MSEAERASELETALRRVEEEARQGKIHSEGVRVDQEWPVHETIHRFSVIRQIARAALREEDMREAATPATRCGTDATIRLGEGRLSDVEIILVARNPPPTPEALELHLELYGPPCQNENCFHSSCATGRRLLSDVEKKIDTIAAQVAAASGTTHEEARQAIDALLASTRLSRARA